MYGGLNGGLQKGRSESYPWTCERALTWEKLFADVTKNLEMRSPWIRVALNPKTSVLIRDRRGEAHTRDKAVGRLEAGMGLMHPRHAGS